jgi:predicted nuclease of restriction endonuclease-like RecB superfamily
VLFADSEDKGICEYVSQLISLYEKGCSVNMLHREISAMAEELSSAMHIDKVVHSGFVKVIESNIEFSRGGSVDYQQCRREVFAAAKASLQQCGADFQLYRQLTSESCVQVFDAVRKDIYGDLPGFETALAFRRRITAKEAIREYNLSLLQGIILRCTGLKIKFSASDRAVVRQFLRLLRFYRLAAESVISKNEVTTYTGGFSAAASEQECRQAALAQAKLIPAVLSLPEWKIEAEFRGGTQKSANKFSCDCTGNGSLDSSARLRDFLPAEVVDFAKTFRLKSDKWHQIADAPLKIDSGGRVSAADFSFEDSDGKVRELFLFYFQQQEQLKRSIDFIRENPGCNLLLGIERDLCCDEKELLALCGASQRVAEHCFLFRDFPGAETVRRILEHSLCCGGDIAAN